MRKKAKHEKEPNLERWLVSYADFITLLFAVFVTLYAMSQSDKKKVEEVSLSIRQAFGVVQATSAPAGKAIESTDFAPIPDISSRPSSQEAPAAPETDVSPSDAQAEMEEFADIKKEITSILVARGDQDKIKLTLTSRGLVISLKEAGFFDSGSATMHPSSLPLLEETVKQILKSDNDVRVEGHTDNVPIRTGAFLSNWELSTARSTSIVRHLIDVLHFPPARLSASGYGEYRPIADNREESGRAKNRRVDIVILSKSAQQSEPPQGFRQED